MEFTVGALLEGKVKSITKFGAFITLPENRTGMVHISEVASTFVNDIKDFLQEGQQVKAGDLLVTLEAMKMNTPVNSPADGTVARICVSAGQSVNEGEVLLSLS
mgnify:CR=1 FL=1